MLLSEAICHLATQKMRERTVLGVHSRVPALEPHPNSSQAGFQVGQREARSSEKVARSLMVGFILPVQGHPRGASRLSFPRLPLISVVREGKAHQAGLECQ